MKSENTLQIIRVKQIGVIRARGEYKDAYAKLKAMLKAKPNVLAAQKEAAQVLLDWAAAEPAGSKNRVDLLKKAASGDADDANPDLRMVWGWSKLRTSMYNQPTFKTDQNVRDFFFQASQRMAEVRYRIGLELKEGDPNKPKYFEAAKKIIQDTHNDIDEGMGGPALKGDFEKLLKSIQTALKSPPNGFQEFIEQRKKSEAATTAAAVTK